MPPNYQNSLGWLELSLRADRLKQQQTQDFQREQMSREQSQQDINNALSVGKLRFQTEADRENRKLQLADMMARVKLREEGLSTRLEDKQAFEQPKIDAAVAKLRAELGLIDTKKDEIPKESARRDKDVTSEVAERDTRHGDRIRAQNMDFYGTLAGKYATPDLYNKRLLSPDESFLSGLSKTLKSGAQAPKTLQYALFPTPEPSSAAPAIPGANPIPYFEQARSQPRPGDASIEVPAEVPGAQDIAVPEIRSWAESEATQGTPSRISEPPPAPPESGPLKLTPPTSPTPNVEAIDTDKQTVDLAMKNMVQGQSTLNAFKKAKSQLESIPEGDFGFWARSKELRLPKEVPWLGGLGVTVPGRNKLEEEAVDAGLQDSFLGRKLIQSFRGEAEKPDPGKTAIEERVTKRDVARASAQDLSSQISLMRLGTTSTAAQDARIDRILGMLNDEAFGKNKVRTLAIMEEAEKEVQRLQRYYQFVAKNHMLPVGDLPDPEDLAEQSAKTKQQGVPKTPSGL